MLGTSCTERRLRRLLDLADGRPFALILSSVDERPGPALRRLLDEVGPWQEVRLDAGQPPYGIEAGEPRLRLVHGLHFLSEDRRRELHSRLNMDRDQIDVRGLQLLLWCRHDRLAELLLATPDLTSWTRGVWDVQAEVQENGAGLEQYPCCAATELHGVTHGPDLLAREWIEQELTERAQNKEDRRPVRLIDPTLERAARAVVAVVRQRAMQQRVVWLDGRQLDPHWLKSRVAASPAGELVVVLSDEPLPESAALQVRLLRQGDERLVRQGLRLHQWVFTALPATEPTGRVHLTAAPADEALATGLYRQLEQVGIRLGLPPEVSSLLSPAERAEEVAGASRLVVPWSPWTGREGWMLRELAWAAEAQVPIIGWSPEDRPRPAWPGIDIRWARDLEQLLGELLGKGPDVALDSLESPVASRTTLPHAIPDWQEKLAYFQRREASTLDPEARSRLRLLIEEMREKSQEQPCEE